MKSWKLIVVCLVIAIAAILGWRWYNGATDQPLLSANVPAGNPVNAQAGKGSGQRAASRGSLVVVRQATTETVNDKLTAIGTGVALSTVSVTPYSSGTLREILVDAGAKVEKNQILAKLDAETEEIAVQKAQVALKDAQNTQTRMATLRASNTATQVQVVAAELALANAQLALQDAQLALDRRLIKAPIAGVIGILPVNAGNYVTASTSIATIDDRTKVLIDIWVPERFAPQIRIGQAVSAEPTALPGKRYQGQVSAVDNMIDPASRTLRVRSEITNPSDVLRAGMSFEVTMLFPGDQYPSVDPLAIQWDGEGSFVWKVSDGVATRIPARIVQRNVQAVLIDGGITAGDQIVTEGVQTVRDGAAVTIKGQQPQNNASQPAANQPAAKQAE